MGIMFLTIGLMALAAAVSAIATLRLMRSRTADDAQPTGLRPRQPQSLDGEGGALALFDLDDLTGINVAQGFDTGDRLLNAVGDTLRRGLPPGAGLERLEGGRFVVWLPDADLARATDMVERMRVLAAQTLVETRQGQVACEVTAAVVAGLPDECRSRAILRADAVLAQAKARGGARTEAVLALPIMALAPSRGDVEAAITRRELEYHVQPIVDLTSGAPVGVEALLRWNRPDGSIVGPAGFIDTLNRIPEAGSDLLADLAVETARPFVIGESPIFITFNITGAVLDGKGSPGCSWLTHVLQNVPTEHLVLELIETAVIVSTERAQDLTARTRAMGVRIALDDFGTGLSNIERLCDLPVDIIKIDRAFIQAMCDNDRVEVILKAMVSMAESLGIDLVAEGIETEEQANRLRDIGVRYGQGFLYGHPATAQEWADRMGRAA
ncbi:GGDEF domain-containing phosphodiesterase [Jannaschia pohangensis]|uniref:Diguanylate cyclase (GGDEF) domain-containing protein n=1 Tax=Jannaschia pohangensis TaxID=390807 RepID=A0A1I3MD45_9RHOB|nr:GGDEF domain-containing phosphodiesterase [Jannaschia pohangensis]SFI95034.1 diguanylate cyclase (GGDEF) domain-containing protein [Jannaschia pohangensis]